MSKLSITYVKDIDTSYFMGQCIETQFIGDSYKSTIEKTKCENPYVWPKWYYPTTIRERFHIMKTVYGDKEVQE